MGIEVVSLVKVKAAVQTHLTNKDKSGESVFLLFDQLVVITTSTSLFIGNLSLNSSILRTNTPGDGCVSFSFSNS